ncbi:CFEM domain protein [Ceratobasidium sp. AG-Ba]|nr:CFEM domain protein [Ceratobasidium sp. AG-Ba]
MRFSLFVIAVAALVGAQNIPPCVVTCSEPAAIAAGCTNSLDVKCVCDHLPAFTASVTPCILSSCSPQDQATALALQTSLCEGSGNPAPSSVSTPPATGSGTGSSATAAPTSSAVQSKNGSSRNGEINVRLSSGLLVLGAVAVIVAF